MPTVSNNEIHRLLMELKDDLNRRCDGIEKANVEGNQALGDRIDRFGTKLEELEQRLDKIDDNHVEHNQKLADTESKIKEIEAKFAETLTSVTNRLAAVEAELKEYAELPEQLRLLQVENEKVKEELENRTNRQLRRTLIFKNIPETKDDESYAEVKLLLAETISSHTDITKQEALDGIERAHREAKRNGGTREGKRRIFAAFLNWELPQKILDGFKQKGLSRTGRLTYMSTKCMDPSPRCAETWHSRSVDHSRMKA